MSDDNMSNDQSRPAEKWDPLTSPYWEPRGENRDEAQVPTQENIEVVVSNSRIVPEPPDVDQILRGEYTGWVPLIKPGDSIETATVRFEVDTANRAAQSEQSFEEMFEAQEEVAPEPKVSAEDISEIKELIREMKTEPEVYVKDFYPNFSEIAKDPDTVTSPAQALEEARRRIEQMRANLQVNLSRVQQSFDHPIFEPTPVTETSVTEEVKPQPVVFEYHATDEPFVTEQVQTEAEHPHIQETIAQTTVVAEEPQKEDHSLELVIMRDEIKDLRDRLDASQKLIETLMERLANLAELALTSRRD